MAGGIDPRLVEQLVEAEKIPINAAKQRKQKFVNEKKEFDKLNTHLTELDTSLNALKSRGDFFKMKVDSSHPDIMDGICKTDALVGSYEFEVRGLARSDKQLAYGWPDKDKTAVGFGYLEIQRDDLESFDLPIEPGSTLTEVAQQINEAGAGVRAMVINTKYNPDSFRLLVVSEKSGEEAKIKIDEDTTFLEFKNQVVGQNLDVLFEDVPVTDIKNQLDELVEGVTFNIKRSEPGTRVQINITYDVDKTIEGIKSFVEKYNQISNFVHKQYQEDPQTGKRGLLSGDSSVKTVMRGLQTTLGGTKTNAGKFQTLSDIGITTDPKSGNLKLDEAKVKSALTEDYEGVSKLFVRGKEATGLADSMATKLKQLRDPTSGAVKSRTKALDNIIKSQDGDIERRERGAVQKEEGIRRRFASLEGQIANLQAQGSVFSGMSKGGGLGTISGGSASGGNASPQGGGEGQ
ncbi:MAG: flagellar filament capping protein FliD [Proteobacteria bacterium]|nr:flagellar filament capping protein FliD [Pseudomonadota bacterium]